MGGNTSNIIRKLDLEGLRIEIIGDSGPFSRLGKSIGYSVSYKGAEYLIDCGAPLFQTLGADGLKKARGFICTHSHDDHKRWFTDIALYFRYTPGVGKRLKLITTDTIHEEYEKNSRAALERTLTLDQRKVIEDPYENFVEAVHIGPRARYRIAAVAVDGKDKENGTVWRIVDAQGKVVPPDKAKIVVKHHHKANRPRILLYDDRYKEWVEPESFYHFGDSYFFEEDRRPFVDEELGIKFTVHNEHNWHGPPTVGVLVETEKERFLFSSDTAYNAKLFQSLADTKIDVQGRTKTKEFLEAPILVGDINDYIERSWSRERLKAVQNLYAEGFILHDATGRFGVVHTDYINIRDEEWMDRAILTHTPDQFTSAFPLAAEGRVFRILGDKMYEDVQGELRAFDADFYVKEMGFKLVGYEDPQGGHKIVDDGGVLHFMPWEQKTDWVTVARVAFYADIDGQYYPMLDIGSDDVYRRRPDGGIERVSYAGKGSKGVLVHDMRDELERRYQRGPFREKSHSS